jgi:ABC-type lipoprotein export system ATPase subunit
MTMDDATNNPVVLEARDLRKTYRLGRVPVPVLKDASIEVRDGEWVAILGASGSGKSTLLHLLGGPIEEAARSVTGDVG